MFDTIFALLHLFVLLGVFGYGVFSLVQGNFFRGALIILLLALYYLLVLHKAVQKEIARKRKK